MLKQTAYLVFPNLRLFVFQTSRSAVKNTHRQPPAESKPSTMQLDIYWTTLLVLLPTVIILTSRNIIIRPLARIQSRWQKVNTEDDGKLDHEPPTQTADKAEERRCGDDDDLRKFRRGFLSIYLLVMSSEWLSGPYLYALLRDDRGLPEPVVVGLYATAYTSAAVSALGVGFLADRYGRRKACLAQCLIHSCACLTVVFGGDYLPVLFLGRVLAGTALTLLWTVFESWMVTEWNARGLDRGGGEGGHGGLSEMFGVMTTTNCMAAIVGGLFGHCMVSVMGSKTWPFWAGIVSEFVQKEDGGQCSGVLTCCSRSLRVSRLS